MLRSLNEIEQTCRKAARGCGLPWGVADEVGKSVRWLHVFGIDGISALVDLLSEVDHRTTHNLSPQSLEGVWQAQSGTLSPIMVGISLCDCLQQLVSASAHTRTIAYPVLTAGFLGQSALLPNQSVEIQWNDVTLGLYRDKLVIEGNQEDLMVGETDGLVCSRSKLSETANSMPMHIGDALVNQQAWGILESFAYKTYVEATEASRLSGAGAGSMTTIDND